MNSAGLRAMIASNCDQYPSGVFATPSVVLMIVQKARDLALDARAVRGWA